MDGQFFKTVSSIGTVSHACATAFNKYTVSKFFDNLLEVQVKQSKSENAFLAQMRQDY